MLRPRSWLLMGFLLPALAWGQELVTVRQAQAHPAPLGGAVALQLRLVNPGATSLTLVKVATPLGRATLQRHTVAAGVHQRQRVVAITVPANGEVRLLPGATEVALTGLTQPLAPGTEFPLFLTFQPSRTQVVRVTVRGHE